MGELMVAIGVLLVAVLTAFGSQLTSMNLMSTSRETAVAMADLQACMESILTMQTDQIPLDGSLYEQGEVIAGYDSLQEEEIVADYPGFPPGGSADPADVPDPLLIVLTVTWQDHQRRERTLTLRSVKTQ